MDAEEKLCVEIVEEELDLGYFSNEMYFLRVKTFHEWNKYDENYFWMLFYYNFLLKLN